MSIIKYRPDIDGLRAIAVLAVVLYHFGIGPLHGGFVGVDIFFVISGYLITSIIQKEIQRGCFTFSGFYERRARRLFPALFFMLLSTLLVGGWLLLPSDLARLGQSAMTTLLFASNVFFWRQSSYFDAGSEYNPLLHTWSLAVEEQFYIGLPVLLLLVHRYARDWLKLLLVVCTVLSLALCLWLQPLRPTATFFLSPFRAWELLIGALLAVGCVPSLSLRPVREAVSVLALLVLLGSLWWTTAGVGFPGWQAIFPVLATAALLHVGAQGDSFVHMRVLQWRPLVLVGLISYSLYLWHWPLLVFARYYLGLESMPPGLSLVLLLVALLLAAASYRWVEMPFRRPSSQLNAVSARRALIVTAPPLALLAMLALSVQLDRGWRSRFQPEIVSLDSERAPLIPYKACDGIGPDLANGKCVIGDLSSNRVALIWGDSHALAWVPAFDSMLKKTHVVGVVAVNSACPPLQGVINPVDPDCLRANEEVLRWLRTHQVDQVYMMAFWSSYSIPGLGYALQDQSGVVGNQKIFQSALPRTIETLRPNTRQIFLIGPTPGAPEEAPFRLARAHATGSPIPAPKSQAEHLKSAGWFWSEAKRYEYDEQISLIDPAPWFCDETVCRYRAINGDLLYRDGDHLSIAGAKFVAVHSHRVISALERNGAAWGGASDANTPNSHH